MPDSIVLGEVRRPVLELLPGDRVDLENDPIADPLGADTGDGEPAYQCEFATVAETVRETESCVLVHFESGPSIGFPVDWKVKVDPEQSRDGWEGAAIAAGFLQGGNERAQGWIDSAGFIHANAESVCRAFGILPIGDPYREESVHGV